MEKIRWQAIGGIQGITIAFVSEREPASSESFLRGKASKNERTAYETAIPRPTGPVCRR